MIERLRERAKEVGKTQKDIARELHVSTANVSFWFRGIVIIKSQYIHPLARALYMSPSEILDIVEWTLVHRPEATSAFPSEHEQHQQS